MHNPQEANYHLEIRKTSCSSFALCPFMEGAGVSQSLNDGSVHHDAGECDIIGIHIVVSVALIVIAMVKRHRERRRRRHGGSRPGKQPSRDYGRHKGGNCCDLALLSGLTVMFGLINN
jgi:hypothetical protein